MKWRNETCTSETAGDSAVAKAEPQTLYPSRLRSVQGQKTLAPNRGTAAKFKRLRNDLSGSPFAFFPLLAATVTVPATSPDPQGAAAAHPAPQVGNNLASLLPPCVVGLFHLQGLLVYWACPGLPLQGLLTYFGRGIYCFYFLSFFLFFSFSVSFSTCLPHRLCIVFVPSSSSIFRLSTYPDQHHILHYIYGVSVLVLPCSLS